MSQAMQAGDVKGIQDLLTRRFPGLQFETMDAGLEEVDKPEETAVATTPETGVAGESEGEETTATLYNDYMAGLPGGVRDLVTTDYKGVRGGRLGAGNYTTASMIPGAQVAAPTPTTPTETQTPAASTASPITTTYNYTYNYPTVPQEAAPAPSPAEPSTPSAPSAPAAATRPTNQQFATQAIQQASGGGVSAAARSTGNTGSINFAEATALMQSGLSKGEIKQRAENQGVKLTDNALRALQGKGKK